MHKIDENLVKAATGVALQMASYDGLGVADAETPGAILTFLDDPRFASNINDNSFVKGVFISKENVSLVSKNIEPIIVDDPRWFFFCVVNYLALTRERQPTQISPKASIHSTAHIADKGVIIEDDVTVEPGAKILADVTVRCGALIRAGAVLGGDGYEHKRTTKGILSVSHDGDCVIGTKAEVGVNTFVPKGFAYRPTLVGDESKLDAFVHFAHGAQCGRRCFIVAHAMIGGNVTMGDDVWVGPTASIANRIRIGDGAFITMGSVVTRDVGDGEKVTGNFAIPHGKFLANLKRTVS